MKILNKLYIILLPLFSVILLSSIYMHIDEFNNRVEHFQKNYQNSNIEYILNLRNDQLFNQYFDYLLFELEVEAELSLLNIKTNFKRKLQISSHYGNNINQIALISKEKELIAYESKEPIEKKHLLNIFELLRVDEKVSSINYKNEHIVIVPIIKEKIINGYLLIHNNLHTKQMDTLKSEMIKTAIFSNIFFLSIFIIATYLVSKLISKPIDEIVGQIENTDFENYTKTELNTQIKEFKILENTLSKMSLQILKKQKDIEELNNNLEIKVQDRTKKLSLAYEDIKQYKQLFEQNKASMILMDQNSGKIVDTNIAALNFYGYTKEEFKDKYIFELNTLSKDEINKEILKAKQEQRDHFFFQHRLKDGTTRDVEVHTGPIKLQNKQLLYSIIHDISEQKIQENIIKEQAKLASMGEMIGNIAHQWRQPLSIISTAATGLSVQKEFDNLSDEEFHQTCDIIEKNAQYLSKTIDDFKNFIKNDKTKNNFNLSDSIESFLNLVDGTIHSHNIQIVLDLQDKIMLNSYENELIQCFMNIFNNAKDALDQIADENRYLFISTSQINNEIKIVFKDNAGGINKNIITKIFEPYFTTKHKSQGTGIGLHMTYKIIVDGMEGNIQAKNENYNYKGINYNGANFTITFSTIKT